MDEKALAVDGVALSQSTDQYSYRRDRTLQERVSNALQYLARQGALPEQDHAAQRYDVGIDSGTHEMVVRVLDKTSGDVLYQIPTKSVLRMAAAARQAASKSCSGGD